jgi:protein-L-isoaspartate(D-aspartate) O-methyltransferase
VSTLPPASDRDSDEARALRSALVDRLVRGGGVTDPRVLDVMRAVPRHAFVPGVALAQAYVDHAQPIGLGQTISQPTIVGEMTQALELSGGERVLEIGTGSGYQAAILAHLAREVYTIELLAPLGEEARARLARLGYTNVHVRIGDGYQGWPDAAPFDRVLLTAAPDEVPAELLDELADGGVLVAPVGPAGGEQVLVRYRKQGSQLRIEKMGGVRFVPMVPGGR